MTFAAVLILQAAIVADRPVDVVRQATHAVENDSGAVATAAWRADLSRDSTSARALLALATLERLGYDYAAAERHYAVLLARPARDAYRAWASLGVAEGRLYRVTFDSAAALFMVARNDARAAGDSAGMAEALFGLAMARARTAAPSVAIAITDTGLRAVPARDADIAA